MQSGSLLCSVVLIVLIHIDGWGLAFRVEKAKWELAVESGAANREAVSLLGKMGMACVREEHWEAGVIYSRESKSLDFATYCASLVKRKKKRKEKGRCFLALFFAVFLSTLLLL